LDFFRDGVSLQAAETEGDQCSSAEAEEMYWAVRTVKMKACRD
jgi:hypothetical protein